MTEITLNVPDGLTALPVQERDNLFRAGLREAIRSRIKSLKTEIAQAQRQIALLETKYNMTFIQFESDLISTLDSWQSHEDYNDWFYWQTVLDEKRQLLADLKKLGIDASSNAT